MAIKTKIQLRRDTLNAWQSANPTLAMGEVALVDKNNGVGEPLWVIRIGDGSTPFNGLPETAYALRSEVESLGDDVLSSAKKYTDDVSAFLSGKIDEVKDQADDLQDQVDAVSAALTSEVKTREDEVATLSAEISAKVKIENVPTDYINISRVDAETYHSLINGGTIDEKTVYIVSSDNINAFGERIINVGDATDLSDAVNLKQLNSVENSLTATISSVSSDLQKQIDDLEDGSEELISTISSLLDGRIDAVSGVVDDVSADLYDLSDKFEALDESLSDYEVAISALGRSGDTFSYQITQGGVEKGVIEVPYDVFVNGGEVQKIGDKTWLFLTLNNEASTVLSIEATDLVDVYTPDNKSVAEGGTISVSIDNYKVAAEVLDGSITAAKLSSDSVTTEKIVDKNVTTAKIADDAVTNAQLADDAVQTENILDGAITPDKMNQLSTFVFDCGNANG